MKYRLRSHQLRAALCACTCTDYLAKEHQGYNTPPFANRDVFLNRLTFSFDLDSSSRTIRFGAKLELELDTYTSIGANWLLTTWLRARTTKLIYRELTQPRPFFESKDKIGVSD